MKVKLIAFVLILSSLMVGSYFHYQHNYVQTLMLSEIVGKTDDNLANIAVNLFDFDTGVTRHDIKQLNDNKDYWLERIKEVDAIQNEDQKQQAIAQLISDMMEDPVLKKICSGLFKLGSEFSFGLIKMIL